MTGFIHLISTCVFVRVYMGWRGYLVRILSNMLGNIHVNHRVALAEDPIKVVLLRIGLETLANEFNLKIYFYVPTSNYALRFCSSLDEQFQ